MRFVTAVVALRLIESFCHRCANRECWSHPNIELKKMVSELEIGKAFLCFLGYWHVYTLDSFIHSHQLFLSHVYIPQTWFPNSACRLGRVMWIGRVKFPASPKLRPGLWIPPWFRRHRQMMTTTTAAAGRLYPMNIVVFPADHANWMPQRSSWKKRSNWIKSFGDIKQSWGLITKNQKVANCCIIPK